MPILTYDNQDAVPEDVRKDATEIKEGDNKGKWQVNLVSRKSLESFRDKNIEVSEKLRLESETVGKFRGLLGLKADDALDFEKLGTHVGELNETFKLVGDGKIKKTEDIENTVKARMEIAQRDFDKAVAGLNQQLAAEKLGKEAAEKALDRTHIDREVASAGLSEKLGVHPSAINDITQRAYAVFNIEKDPDGSVRLLPKINGVPVYGKDGTSPRSVAEWIDNDVRATWPHYFKQSTGGGAGHGDSQRTYGGLSEAEFNKLPPEERLRRHNQANPAGKGK